MAIAGKWLASNFNRPGFELFNFRVYAVCSDGDIMEGVGGEAAYERAPVSVRPITRRDRVSSAPSKMGSTRASTK